jgi:hypothetical protein
MVEALIEIAGLKLLLEINLDFVVNTFASPALFI